MSLLIWSSKMTKQEKFVTRSKIVHGDQYGYEKFIYLGCKVKGAIICQTHGDFQQTPNDHMNGAGCPACGINKSKELRASNKDLFEFKAREVHGNKYSYENFIYSYKNSTSNLKENTLSLIWIINIGTISIYLSIIYL